MNALGSLVVLGAVLLAGCSTPPAANAPSPNQPARYRLTVSDRPDLNRFVLTLKSLDERPLCLNVNQWPNYFGQVHFGSIWVKLVSNQGTYPARDENFGSCIGPSCVIHIAPGSALTAFIGYKEFGTPAKIAGLSRRRLHLIVSPSVCGTR
jgi:hypothetical protein